ncbi:MAG: C25 family cysteine peptidase [Anaerolineae bacterium]|nr:C25 family cysteine peptidase [Anaerolineae bacterium]
MKKAFAVHIRRIMPGSGVVRCLVVAGLLLTLGAPVIASGNATVAGNGDRSLLRIGALQGGDALAAGAQAPDAETDELVVELMAPEPTLTVTSADDGQLYTRVEMAGFTIDDMPGRPALPLMRRLLVVPPGGQWSVETRVQDEQVMPLTAPVLPVPEVPLGPSSDLVGLSLAAADEVHVASPWEAQAATDTDAAPATTPAVMVEDAGYVRDMRLARLTFVPARYDPASQELRVIRRAQAVIRFTGSQMPPLVAAAADSDPGEFRSLVRAAVINPEAVDIWRANPPLPLTVGAAAAAVPDDGTTRYRVTLRESGLYRLTHGALAEAGVPVASTDPRHFRLFRGAQEVAIEVTGEEDGRFDPVDEIRFYGEAVQSIYTDVNTYWLVIDGVNGRRMTGRSAAPQSLPPASSFPATRVFEENRIYRSIQPAQSGVDHWFWRQMFFLNTTGTLTFTVPFTIEHVLPAGTATLLPELWGGSSDPRVAPDHRVRVFINGTQIGQVEWDGMTAVRQPLTFDQALLREGGNTVTFYTPGDTGARDTLNRLWESNWLNWFSVTYQRAFVVTGDRLEFTPVAGLQEFLLQGWSAADVLLYDVTDPKNPVRLTGAVSSGNTLRFAVEVPQGGRYHAVASSAVLMPQGIGPVPRTDLRNPAEGADYLLISHADFLAGVAPLAELRREQGLRVRVIDVQEIYDTFSDGLLNPWAIRDFIAYAYFNWPGSPPAYVLLVGDGTYDFKNYEGYGARTFIPPLLEYVDPSLGETAADNRFVTVVGNDIMPDLHLGRLPVNNQAELSAMIDKIVAYERNPTPGAWRSRAVFISDNPDVAGPFHYFSDEAVAVLPPELDVTKVYLGTTEYPTNQAVRAQQATLDAFNQGALFFNYVGHSSVTGWAAELLFSVNSLPQVNNGSRYPVMLPMTCLEGTYHNPRFSGLSESVVRLSGKGAVASWAPTGLGVASGHDYLHTGFYRAVFDQGVYELGPATTAGRLNLFLNSRSPGGVPRFHDLIDTYVLLGDPATRIGLPAADLDLVASGPGNTLLGPGDPVVFVLRYQNTGGARVKQIVISADLPDALTDLTWQADDPGLRLRAGSRLVWDSAEMAPGARGTITITARLPMVLDPASLPLTAEMSIRSPWPEANRANNTSGRLPIRLMSADLLLAQTVEPTGHVKPGDLVTFTLGYANLGPARSPGVTIALPLPVELEDVQFSYVGPAANLIPGAHYEWTLGTVDAGAKGRIIMRGRVPHILTVDQLVWEVSGRISGLWPESNSGNNTAPTALIYVDVGDLLEPDNTRGAARRLHPPVLDGPHTYDPIGDQDWVVFRGEAGMRYLARTVTRGGSDADTVLFLWDEAGRLLAKNDNAGPSTRLSQISWVAEADQDYYLMVTSSSLRPGFIYWIEILALPYGLHLPLVLR